MKQNILKRIQKLGGSIESVKGISLKEDFQAISFSTVLYPKPTDTPWASKEEAEPICGISDYVDEHMELYHSNKTEFYNNLISHYYQNTQEGRGQTFFENRLFTPFTKGTSDYEEWKNEWEEENFQKVIVGDKMELMFIGLSYGYPDNFFICITDPNPDNPMVYSTDHEEYFDEITVEKTLEEYFNSFFTKEELIEVVELAINK